jgi:hypothetical protein
MTLPLMNDPPQLAAPGAGLPWIELQVARLGFGWLSRHTTREKSAGLLARERDAILDLAGRCDESAGSRRVLIKRIPGMEDSSRYWSIFMTVEHLRIVNHAVAQTIQLLGRGEVPDRAASTADVKPGAGADAKAVRQFELSCALVERAAAHLENLRTGVRFAHPWFGPLDAGQWYFLAGFHMGLHRQQIKAILKGL